MKYKTAIILVMLIILLLCGCRVRNNGEVLYQDIVSHADFIQYNYDQLKEAAEIIAEVEIVDELSEDNSYLVYSDDAYKDLLGFYSLREAKILSVYKGKEVVGDKETIRILDGVALEGGKRYMNDGYEGVQNGKRYLVFLNDNNASGEMSIISNDNGVIDLSDISGAAYYDIAVKAAVEYMSDLPDAQKKEILSMDEIKRSDNIDIELTSDGSVIVEQK